MNSDVITEFLDIITERIGDKNMVHIISTSNTLRSMHCYLNGQKSIKITYSTGIMLPACKA